MFTQKKVAAPVTVASNVSNNKFIGAAKKQAAVTRSQNGAVKYTTSGNPLVDQLKAAGSYLMPRKFSEVASDMAVLWANNPTQALRFTGYLRAINRNTVKDGTAQGVVNGEGLKNEAIMRMLWLAVNHRETFEKNLSSFVALGSWKDIFTMLTMDLSYNGWDNRALPWDTIVNFIIRSGLQDKHQVNLVKKYLPSIKASSKCRTVEAQAKNIIAKLLCAKLFGNKQGEDSATYKQYRVLKASGTAHQWQTLISQGRFEEINFDKIHGKALSILIKSKTFLTKTGLKAKFTDFISAKAQKGESVKATDYVFDILGPLADRYTNLEPHQTMLINAQYAKLLESCPEEIFPWIVVRDTSGSMDTMATGLNYSADHVAKSLALMFSGFLKGTFKDCWIEFNSTAKLHEWVGSTVVEKYRNDRTNAISSTDPLKVIELFCNLKSSGVPEEHFPKGIICISDGEFNRVPGFTDKTNLEEAKSRLRAFFSTDFVDNFKFVFWDVATPMNAQKKFESYGKEKNVYYFGGFSPAVIKFVQSADDAFIAAENCLDQPILRDMIV